MVPHTVEISGKKNEVTNAVVVTKNKNANDVYFTGSSTRFDLTNALYEISTKGSGRVYKYNPEKNTSEGMILDPTATFMFLVEERPLFPGNSRKQ